MLISGGGHVVQFGEKIVQPIRVADGQNHVQLQGLAGRKVPGNFRLSVQNRLTRVARHNIFALCCHRNRNR